MLTNQNLVQITSAQLEAVAQLLKTADKNTVYTFVIGALVKAGYDFVAAYESVFGRGSYNLVAAAAAAAFDALRKNTNTAKL